MTDLTNTLRQGDLPTVPSSFSAWVEIDGSRYAVVKVAVRYSRTETKLVVDLAVGRNARNVEGIEAIDPNFEFVKGTPAKAVLRVDERVTTAWAGRSDRQAGRDILLKAGEHVLLDGVIDDGGPADLETGRFNLRCVIVSKLLYLATGATHFTNVRANHLDTSGLLGLSSRDYPGGMDIDLAQIDFWAALKTAFTDILTTREIADLNNRIARFLDFTGGDASEIPQTTLNALDLVQGSLDSGIFATDMARVVSEYLNRELHRDLVQQSILAKIQALADDFFFAMIEHGDGAGVVPYTPFVHSSDCKTLWPSATNAVGWQTHDTSIVNGVVFIQNPFGILYNNNQVDGDQFIIGGYKRRGVSSGVNDIDPSGGNLGLFTTLPAPAWMHGRVSDLSNQAAVSPFVSEATVETIRAYANPYAREIALRDSYRGRGVVVSCPLRMDIGPCTPVRIIYPALAGTGVDESTAIFGAVESVTLVIDATAKQAATNMEVLYVRSQTQQSLDVDERPADGSFGGQGSFVSARGFHPLWAEPYLGRRLDESPAEGVYTVPDVDEGGSTQLGEEPPAAT